MVENVDADEAGKKDFNEFEFMTSNLFSLSTKWLEDFFFLSRSVLYMVFICVYVTTILLALIKLVIIPTNIVWANVTSNISLLVVYLPVSIISVLFHEVGHAFVANRYGIRTDKITFAVYYYISLICYIRTPGIYTLSEKRRIEIWSAGFATNLFLASLFYILTSFASGYIRNIFVVFIVSNLINTLACLLPFVYSDGYFILATLLKAPNLRKASLKGVVSLVKNKKLDKKQVIYTLYTLFFIILGSYFIISRVVIISNDIYVGISQGVPIHDFFEKYANLTILLLIGIGGKIIKARRKVRKNG